MNGVTLFIPHNSALVMEGGREGSHLEIHYCVHVSYCICVFLPESGIKDLTDCNQLLSQSPKMCFYPVKNGVWLIPASGSLSPPNLMMYWNYIQVNYVHKQTVLILNNVNFYLLNCRL